ncbi:MAG: hypothetical protein ACQCN6_08050 [Candidatus Bathyarchaeia archaeon]
MKDAMMTEDGVVSKVAELMETLDHVKKYNMLARSLKIFAYIVLGSITAFSVLSIFLEFLSNNAEIGRSTLFFASAIVLLIPIVGFVGGTLFVRKRVNSVKVGEWRDELSEGFPAAIKILVELDWEQILEEISIVKLSYALYGLLKTVAYGVIIFFGVELAGNALVIVVLGSTSLSIFALFALLSLIILLWVVGRDLLRRYKEIEALNLLLLELRWFSLEFRRFDF